MTDYPPGSVVITPAQMYDEIKGLRGDVAKLTAVVDPALTDVKEHVNDHEGRIRSLERRVWMAAGIATGAGFGLSQLAEVLSH